MTSLYFVTAIVCLFSEINTQSIGSTCILDNGLNGVCSSVHACPTALAAIQDRKLPQLCEFNGQEPIVCCSQIRTLISEKQQAKLERAECVVLRNDLLQAKQRVLFIDNARLKFAEQLHQLRVKRSGRTSFLKLNPNSDVKSIIGGQKVQKEEFPYMARLGIGENESHIDWYCGGSLITDKFILTAAHCIMSRYGTINWALLGDPESNFLQERIQISNNIVHPNYNYLEHYHDIALSEMKEKIYFSPNIIPGCIYIQRDIPSGVPIRVTGWGSTEIGGEASKDLLKADVSLFTFQECSEKYNNGTRRLAKGIDDETQFCAGGRTESKDTCQGDSGGPIQIMVKNTNNEKIYSIIGITSFGKSCGFINQPGVYVRLYPYLEWIESIVSNLTIT